MSLLVLYSIIVTLVLLTFFFIAVLFIKYHNPLQFASTSKKAGARVALAAAFRTKAVRLKNIITCQHQSIIFNVSFFPEFMVCCFESFIVIL
jgi:hypothetical protein